MSRQRTPVIEGVLHRIEDRIEAWRKQDRAHKAEAATQREKLWVAAAEREKLLAEAVTEEVYQYSTDEVARRHRVVFVMRSEEASQVLEPFAAEKGCLEKMVPGKGGYEEAGMKGS